MSHQGNAQVYYLLLLKFIIFRFQYYNEKNCYWFVWLYLKLGGDLNTFSHLTVAEINGGLDGLLLGLHAKKEAWSTSHRSELTLSQVKLF